MKDAKLTLTGIPVAVLIAFWMSMALRIPKEGSPGGVIAWLFPAFGDDLCPSSAVPLSWSLFADWLEWKNVEYAITNRRTVIRRGVWQVSELSRTHSDSPIEVRASTDGALGDVIFQARGKLNISGLKEQLSGMFNPELRTSAFGLYAVEHPGDVYRTILSQTSAAPDGAKHNV